MKIETLESAMKIYDEIQFLKNKNFMYHRNLRNFDISQIKKCEYIKIIAGENELSILNDTTEFNNIVSIFENINIETQNRITELEKQLSEL